MQNYFESLPRDLSWIATLHVAADHVNDVVASSSNNIGVFSTLLYRMHLSKMECA